MSDSAKRYRRLKRTSLTDSSETSDDETHSGKQQECEMFEETPTSPVRFSRRLETKGKRKLHIPSRDEVFSKLVPKGTPTKNLDSFRPRKLINNFMKVHNQYNYDPDYSSSGDSADDFIQYSDEESATDSFTTDGSDSVEYATDSESDDQPKGSNVRSQNDKKRSEKKQNSRSDQIGDENVVAKGRRRILSLSSSTDEESDDDSEITRTSRVKKRKQSISVLTSSDEDDSEDEITQTSRVKKQKQSISALTSSDEDESEGEITRTSRVKKQKQSISALTSSDEDDSTGAIGRSKRVGFLRERKNKRISPKLAEYKNQRHQKQVRK